MPEIVHWNPKRWGRLGRGPVSRWIPARKGFDNFGDLLGPMIVRRIHERRALGRARGRTPRLLAVGSIMRLAATGDVVWGAGINGKTVDIAQFPVVDVRAVRGPRTAAVLRSFGNEVPDVFGDPALLIPHLWTDAELGIRRRTSGTVLMPNYNDLRTWPSGAIDPRGDPIERVRLLASAERVVASSLHAIAIAEAYGVPAVLVASAKEKPFKYIDYYEGTGREAPRAAESWEEGLDTPGAPPISGWNHSTLLDAFPDDLWHSR
ncbi:polysaccharide pyruvyl transferase family protein [Microbacterium cremeum]|uniref:polysaccharide pyruvyl transferase family protein n=1 Tax=Microbacterium cremeum TaxID=2782169 RepID=UPI001889ACC1|nr:polysaccharide pyruvyl transferase family protein [Microbacterium cremeum]